MTGSWDAMVAAQLEAHALGLHEGTGCNCTDDTNPENGS